MTKQLKNLFPETIKKGAIQIFGEQAISPVLIELLSAGAATGQHQADAHLANVLHPNEAAILSGYTFPKRRSEYLTGRFCAKMAIQQFLNLHNVAPAAVLMPEIEIAKMANGRPNVRLHTEQARPPKMDISISHSGGYGVAVAAGSKCGIDLQAKKETLRKVQEKYCSNGEFILLEKFLPNHATIKRLAILWAAKEAAKKALSHRQMPGFLDLELSQLKNFPDFSALYLHIPQEKSQQMPEKVIVVTGMFDDDYALAICLINEDSDAGIARS